MAIKYLSGLRLTGTEAERLAMSGTGMNTGANTSWKLLGSGTGSSVDNIPCSSTFTAKDNMMILGYDKASGSGTTYSTMFFNADVSSGAYRWQIETDAGGVSRQGDTWIASGQGQASKSGRNLSVLHFRNMSGEYRIGTAQNVFSADTGAGNNVKRRNTTWKWGDNSTALTQATISNLNGAGGGDYSEGEIIVLGCNDDETDGGTNFWQQLAFSDTITDGVLDSGTFTAKKWLMYECSNVIVDTYNNHSLSTTFNATGDTNEYATRRSGNGSGDTSDEVSSDGVLSSGDVGQQFFERGYILNRDDGEKLVIIENTAQPVSANSGDATTLQRNQVVGKWANNSQVTSIQKRDWRGGGTALVSGSITVYGGEA